MIISNSNKFIFVHIPKCAGISITDAFVKTIKWNDIILHGGKAEYGAELEPYFERNFQLHGHQTAAIIKNTTGRDIWRNYYSFSFVRNPYSRIVSLYTFVARIVNNTNKRKWKEQEWYKWPLFHAYLTTENYSGFIRSHFFDKDHVTRDQFSWVCDDQRKKIIVDFIGKTETLELDFEKILGRLQMQNLNLEELNISAKKDYRKYYTNEEDIAFIYDKYRIDFDKFGYPRQLEQV